VRKNCVFAQIEHFWIFGLFFGFFEAIDLEQRRLSSGFRLGEEPPNRDAHTFMA